MYYRFEIYPEDRKSLFYIEFIQFNEKDKLTYRIMKRHWEEFAKNALNPTGELHGWQLLSGEVNQLENAIDFETEAFLKFVIDSMNKNSNE